MISGFHQKFLVWRTRSSEQDRLRGRLFGPRICYLLHELKIRKWLNRGNVRWLRSRNGFENDCVL